MSEKFNESIIRPFPKGETAAAAFSEDRSQLLLLEKNTRMLSVYKWREFSQPAYQISLAGSLLKQFFVAPINQIYLVSHKVLLLMYGPSHLQIMDGGKTTKRFLMKSHVVFDLHLEPSTPLTFELTAATRPILFYRSTLFDQTELLRLQIVGL